MTTKKESGKHSKNGVGKTETSKKKSLKNGVNKSRHLNVLKRRLRKWMDTSNRGNIIIETMTHPLKNNKALISLRQFRMDEDKKKSKTVFGDLMVIHSDNLDSYIKRLQKIKDKLTDNNTNEIVIDEWDIKAEQSKFRKELSDFAVEKMRFLFWPVVKNECYACKIKEPSQRRHQCCTDIKTNVDDLLDTLVERIKWNEIEKVDQIIDVNKLLDDSDWREQTKESLIKALTSIE